MSLSTFLYKKIQKNLFAKIVAQRHGIVHNSFVGAILRRYSRKSDEDSIDVSFAKKFNLKPNEALLLPGLFQVAAQKTDLGEEELMKKAEFNQELGEYMVEMVKKVAKTDEAEEEYQKFLEEKAG